METKSFMQRLYEKSPKITIDYPIYAHTMEALYFIQDCEKYSSTIQHPIDIAAEHCKNISQDGVFNDSLETKTIFYNPEDKKYPRNRILDVDREFLDLTYKSKGWDAVKSVNFLIDYYVQSFIDMYNDAMYCYGPSLAHFSTRDEIFTNAMRNQNQSLLSKMSTDSYIGAFDENGVIMMNEEQLEFRLEGHEMILNQR